MGSVLSVLAIAGMFLILIAPHEAGHFLFAKLFKVRVIEFSIGLGNRIWSTTRGGTLYALRPIPVAGYVRMGGMEPGDFAEPNGFHTRPHWQRLVILFGGPLANFVVAILLVTGSLLTQVNTDPGLVRSVDNRMPAYAAGVRAGDSIKTVNGQPVVSTSTILEVEGKDPGAPITLTGVHADGRAFTYTITPAVDPQANNQLRVGIAPAQVITVVDSVQKGVTFPLTATAGIFSGLYELATGGIPGGFLGPQGLTGPVGLGDIATQAVDTGPLAYVGVVALLSVALGVTNLLPLPALDGGRIVVVVAEWVRRRPFDRDQELAFQRFGLVALLLLATLITVLDVHRIATGQFPSIH